MNGLLGLLMEYKGYTITFETVPYIPSAKDMFPFSPPDEVLEFVRYEAEMRGLRSEMEVTIHSPFTGETKDLKFLPHESMIMSGFCIEWIIKEVKKEVDKMDINQIREKELELG